MFPEQEEGEEGGRDREQQPFAVAAPLLGLDERQEQGDDPEAEQDDADRVEVAQPYPARVRGVGEQAPGEQDADDAERQVDVEDPAPALLVAAWPG